MAQGIVNRGCVNASDGKQAGFTGYAHNRALLDYFRRLSDPLRYSS